MSIALLNCYRRQQTHGVGGLVRSLCAAIRCRAQQKYVLTTLTAPRRAKHPPNPHFDERAHAMRKGILSIAAASLLAVGSLAACGDDSGSDSGSGNNGGGKTPKIGVILPDSKSSVRWETADRKFLSEAFKAAGVESDIQNAQGDKNAFQTLA